MSMTPEQLREWAVEQERQFEKGTQSASIARAHADALEDLAKVKAAWDFSHLQAMKNGAAYLEQKDRAERAEAALADAAKRQRMSDLNYDALERILAEREEELLEERKHGEMSENPRTLCEYVKCITDDGQELPMRRCPTCKRPSMVGYKCDGCEADAAKRELSAAKAALEAVTLERDKLKGALEGRMMANALLLGSNKTTADRLQRAEAALAESERRAERLRAHAEAMHDDLEAALPCGCRSVAADNYRADYPKEN